MRISAIIFCLLSLCACGKLYYTKGELAVEYNSARLADELRNKSGALLYCEGGDIERYNRHFAGAWVSASKAAFDKYPDRLNASQVGDAIDLAWVELVVRYVKDYGGCFVSEGPNVKFNEVCGFLGELSESTEGEIRVLAKKYLEM